MVVAEVVVGIVGWIRGFWGSQGVGVSGDRTWWGVVGDLRDLGASRSG